MGRFVNANGVTFHVSDDKDDRYSVEAGYKSADAKVPAKKAAPSKTSK